MVWQPPGSDAQPLIQSSKPNVEGSQGQRGWGTQKPKSGPPGTSHQARQRSPGTTVFPSPWTRDSTCRADRHKD